MLGSASPPQTSGSPAPDASELSLPTSSMDLASQSQDQSASFLDASMASVDNESLSYSRLPFDTKSTRNPIFTLEHIWMNERGAPELLPFRADIVDSMKDLIEEQTDRILDMEVSNPDENFYSMIYQTEIERLKFLLKSYLRTRLFKIEKFALWLLRQDNAAHIMSPHELEYARSYQTLLETHHHETFAHMLPHTQQKQDEEMGDISMVVTPNLEAPVFVKALDATGPLHIAGPDEEDVSLEKGDIYLLRYSAVKQLLSDRLVRLI
ncbi:hypothetical protein BCR43DRAFT_476917 [Syncephalastrum racemosum]|uniref:DNA replication complex GINS protein SLD5 n=1 Tax=Syncephalastrum racemosum TaxID=13706 RepID=A0A1X2H8V1_SYNRA|nr:hypothetical protein BCR43DRAFT_476917 [Syncephalastrum racemosum]